MATHHGKEGVVKAGGTGIGEITGFTLETTGDVVEDTALTDAAKSFLAGRTSFSGTLEMNYDETDSPQQTLTVGRENIAQEVQARLQSYLDIYQTGLLVQQVNIEKTDPPAAVKNAFDDVVAAREDKERLQNEAERYALTIVPEARGQAQARIRGAEAYKEEVVAKAEGEVDRFNKLLEEYAKAPEVTRDRLYLDALQSVLSNSTKIMVDVEGGNNLLYLPLDKIMEENKKKGDDDE